MSDTPTEERPVDRRRFPRADPVALARDQARARWFGHLRDILFAVIVLTSTALMVTDRRSNGERIDDLTQQVDDLTVDLREARDVIDAATAADDERELCERRLTADTRTTNRDVQRNVARLVVTIASVGLPDRAVVIQENVRDLNAAIAADDEAVAVLNAWQSSLVAQQLPCPL